MTKILLDEFTKYYVNYLLYKTTNGVIVDDLPNYTLLRIIQECKTFQANNKELISYLDDVHQNGVVTNKTEVAAISLLNIRNEYYNKYFVNISVNFYNACKSYSKCGIDENELQYVVG